MRITHQMLSRNYLTRMNKNQTTLKESNERLSAQRKFNKGYENVTDAGKALRTRKLVAANERYQVAVRDAEGRAASAEESLRTVNSLLITTKEKLIQGMNGTYTQAERDKIATEVTKHQEEVLQLMNSSFADKPIFAAAGNKDGSPPFSTDASGQLSYNGTLVDDMVFNPDTGNVATLQGTFFVDIPYNADNYIDIGYGYSLTSEGKVDPNTAFKDTYSGVESFGYGVNEDGVPINAHSLMGYISTSLKNGDVDAMGKALDALPQTMDYLLTTITEIGSRGVTLENTMANLEKEYNLLAETQTELEGIDLAEEITYNKQYEMNWMVTLQMGSKVLPQTIFDFIR